MNLWTFILNRNNRYTNATLVFMSYLTFIVMLSGYLTTPETEILWWRVAVTAWVTDAVLVVVMEMVAFARTVMEGMQ